MMTTIYMMTTYIKYATLSAEAVAFLSERLDMCNNNLFLVSESSNRNALS